MRLRFRGGIYSSRKVCGCGGCPGGYGIRPYGLWDAFIHPMGACCDGNGHGSSGAPTSAELLPAYHWFVGAAHVRPAAVRRRSFADSRRAGHARPLPHDDIKKEQKAAAMRFLHSCGFIYTLLCAHISGVTGTAP